MLKIKTDKDEKYEHLVMPMVEIDKNNELMITGNDDNYEHLILPMVDIVV